MAEYEGLTIHSKYNPLKEAQKIVKSSLEKTNTDGRGITLALFYGFGLGYLVEEFIRISPETPILIIEPDIDFFAMALNVRDMSHFLKSKNIHIAFGNKPQEFLQILEELPTYNILYFKYRPLYQKDNAYFKEIDKLLAAYFKRKEINKNTLNRFGKLWSKNILKNLPNFLEYPGINIAQNLFHELPTTVIAAGPTLDQLSNYLEEIRKRTVLISVDTALHTLLKQGIEPDFVVIVDPQYLNSRYLEWVQTKNTFYIMEPAVYPRTFRLISKRGLLMGSIFPLGKYFEEILGEMGTLGAGGSVSTTAWDFARYIGSNTIFLAGLDLGFPNNNIHCKGIILEHILLSSSNRITPISTYDYSMFTSGSPYRDVAFDGNSIVTDNRMSVYRHWFETQMVLNPQCKTYTLSPLSLKINGVDTIKIDHLLELPPTRETINSKLNYLNKKIEEEKYNLENKRNRLIEGIKTLEKNLYNLKRYSEAGIKKTEELKEYIKTKQNIEPILKELEIIDREILAIKSKDIVGFLAHSITEDIIDKGTQITKPNQAIENSILLYQELARSSQYHLKLLKHLFYTNSFN